MKKILTITLLILTNNIFAQGKWTPVNLFLGSMCTVSHFTFSDCPKEWNDSNSEKDRWIGVSYLPSINLLTDYTRTGNVISFSYYYRSGKSSVTLNIDSIHKTLTLSVIYLGGGQDHIYIDYDSLPFQVIGDSIIASWTNSSSLRVRYDYEFTELCSGFRAGHYGFHESASPIIPLTNSGNLVFVVSQESQTVSKEATTPLNIEISNDILSPNISMSFPHLDHSETLIIYDILGREVIRREIASGVTKYLIAPSQFRNGHYFARLGEITAHFEVH